MIDRCTGNRWGALLGIAAMAACSRNGTPQGNSAEASASEPALSAPIASSRVSRPLGTAALPDIANFPATRVARGDGFYRRTYIRDRARITVTVGRFDVDDRGYERWVRQSRDAYPQADLGLPGNLGNGFYECTGGDPPACNLLIQLRSGIHIEIRSEGTASRAEVDEIAAGLPLRELAAP